MQFDLKDSVKISINTLVVGMFVTSIQKSERVYLSNAGRVSSKKGIDTLVNKGIKYVWVDKKLSARGCKFHPVPDDETTEEQQESSKNPPNKLVSREVRQKNAARIIQEARGLAQKIITATFDSHTFVADELDGWADELIESALINSDALQCVSALRKKDAYLLEHSVNVATLLVTFGKHLGFGKDRLKPLAIGGIIHDVGKVHIDDNVLHKPSRLTEEEFAHIKQHQVFAKPIIKKIEGLSQISRDICLMHHEKLDGTGYPNGLSGEQIPQHGRMACIVDIYDALTADRCYKRGMSPAEAFKIMLGMTPNHLDRQLVYKFINCIGIFPIGAIVELSNGHLGIVWSSNDDAPVEPVVKCFYSRKNKRFIDVKYVDLKHSWLTIVKAISPARAEIDVTPFF
ncbi:HD-GYP domain-containing protein [Vibrio tasmaniensis]|uniref:HD-GYP domain-containing protein n=1 Tax=Vibrio tasmaniensis TaxID=212663 RepID=UPI001117AF90|nr:HD-GYP domain-containing protein [Vibrio tasmaniensis]